MFLSSFFRSLLFQVSIMYFTLILFKYLIPPLLSFAHLHCHVQFHIVHCHFHNEVCLIYLLYLLLSLVPKYFDFAFSSFLCLF